MMEAWILSNINVYCQYLEKRSQDILKRKPDKGYSDAGSIAKYTTWGAASQVASQLKFC